MVNSRAANPPFVELAVEELHQHGVRSEQIDTISPVKPGTYNEATAVREYVLNRKLNL